MHDSWIVLLPPFIVLATSFITKKILPSLMLGIFAASFIIVDFKFLPALSKVVKAFQEQLINIDNMYIFLFLFALGALISLITFTGGTKAYANIIRKRIATVKGAESATILLSIIMLFDDFFSSITVGSIMRPLTDHFNIARAKLAFLIDSMAAPLVVLMPISSWIATLTMQLSKAGVSSNLNDTPLVLSEPFALYISVIPFIFYSILLIVSVFFIVQFRISFGPMKKHELCAQKTGNLFGGREPLETLIENVHAKTGTIGDFLIPIITLLLTTFFAILYSGNYYLLQGTHSLMQALNQANIFYALFLGSSVTLVLSIIYFLIRKKITAHHIIFFGKSSIDLMGTSVAILFCSWVFSNLLLQDLHSGHYLARLLIGNISITFLPCIFFIASAITSIGIGSSWGTIAIMVPLAIPMIINFLHVPTPANIHDIPFLLPLLGAIFSGSVAGDHISPLSSTTIMSAISSGSHLDEHIQTQVTYALPVIGATIVAYIIAGNTIAYSSMFSALISLLVGIIIAYGLLLGLHHISKKRSR